MDFHWTPTLFPVPSLLIAGPELSPLPERPCVTPTPLDDPVPEALPLVSTATTQDPILEKTPTLRETFTKASQRQFRQELYTLCPRVQAKLEQPFGKDNLRQCFRAEASLRHVLLPLWKSGFLSGDAWSWAAFGSAYYPVRLLHDLLQQYGDVDFSSLRGFPSGWANEQEINTTRAAMVSAALMHYNGSAADLVRWIGGPHVAAHRDHPAILRRLQRAGLPPNLLVTLSRIFNDGIPAYCNADSTEANFVAAFAYGNHSTVDADPDKAYKATLKDNKRGYTLLFDRRLMLFLLHAHSTPQGMVDLNTIYKNPRPIFDSSFRPEWWSMAINDWTSKDTEPPLTFAQAEMRFMQWLYNLRITYPNEEIFLADDDVSGAFRWLKYHPNLLALHACVMCGFGLINTGGTFGDNTTPSNFDPLALARRLLAQHIWSHDAEARESAREFLPPVSMAPTPTPEEVSAFARADSDSLNPGVLDSQGQRLPPPYPMHVDDSLYADIGKFLLHTILASLAALFLILGFPNDSRVPPPLSYDKVESTYDHRRKMVGRQFDSRTLTVGMLPHKRDQLIQVLSHWTTLTHYTLPDIASLLGTLDNHTKYCPWARCWYFSLQNSVRLALAQRFFIVSRRQRLFQAKETTYRRTLPPHLEKRIAPLIAKDKARLLWASNQSFRLTPGDQASIRVLLTYLQETTEPWATPLGMIVPRIPNIYSQGDASFVGGGAHCPTLDFWFEIAWSPQIARGLSKLKPSNPSYVHINSCEDIVKILQHAAILTRLDQATPSQLAKWFPQGKPSIPYWMCDIDNMVSNCWDRSMSTSSLVGQNLIGITSELKRQFPLRAETKHLAGKLNVVADDISRQDFSLPSSTRLPQLFAKHPSLATYDYFLPSPELIHLLSSRLFSEPLQAPCVLPKTLGRFLPAGSTTLSLPSL